jgi:hypothetical protein
MRKIKIILAILLLSFLVYYILRPSSGKLIKDLNYKNHSTDIIKAAYELGERKEISAIRPLLENILDHRMSTNINFKGMTVCYCKLVALKKISSLQPPAKLNQFIIDTAAARFYLSWAIKDGYIKQGDEVILNYQ